MKCEQEIQVCTIIEQSTYAITSVHMHMMESNDHAQQYTLYLIIF